MTSFAVITELPTDNEGNYACGKILVVPGGRHHIVGSNILVDPPVFDEELFCAAVVAGKQTTIDLTKNQMIMCNVPVFELGEILVMGSNDRTIPDGRKPSKWDVGCEYFNTIEEAVKRSKEVYDGALNDD
ncbi:MAG: hypothetical protein PHX61_02430 [Alphaproteobacteria bacterium]|nr:hypothetical protein [Alphaproteobacteria bacterium]